MIHSFWRTTRRLAGLLSMLVVAAAAQAQTEFEPPSGKGRVVVAVSGASGAGRYQVAAQKLASFGYDVFLVDGNDVKGDQGAGLKAAIDKALQSPHALPGKVGFVGFSLGGGLSLGYATHWPDQVAVVVAMFPLTRIYSNDIPGFVGRIKVPVLMMAGEKDSYRDCCGIETARAIGAAAADLKLPFELITYPNADHDFILSGRSYNADAANGAWAATEKKLKQYLPS